MILKYPKKNESIYDLNPILKNRSEFLEIGEVKMRFVMLFSDNVDSPFRHKTGIDRSTAVAKCIPEMLEGKRIKDEYLRCVDLKEAAVKTAIALYDELFNPAMIRKIVKRIENLNALSEAQDEFLNYKNNKAFDDDKKEKYQAECSKMIEKQILRKTTDEIEFYTRKLSEHILLPLEIQNRLEGTKENEEKEKEFTDTADDVDVDGIAREE